MSSSLTEQSDIQLARQIEAILFVASDGASVSEISIATGQSSALIRKALTKMSEEFHLHSGMEVVELGGKWFMTSASDMSDTLFKYRKANESEHVRLTRASLETLAVIAYSQPVTRTEIEGIRGVRCDRVIDTLLSYGLIRIAGRRKSVGSPLLYRTTPTFLKIFGLASISDLPTVDEIEELRRKSDSQPGVIETEVNSENVSEEKDDKDEIE